MDLPFLVYNYCVLPSIFWCQYLISAFFHLIVPLRVDT
uniref:Uncharacterized protein n=1 Tax=Arundo donax TaxID=35708 RepID=A0A0A9A9C1_ARUDO